jgi:hypothetical protein
MLSTLVSRYGYTEDSAYRDWADLARLIGSSDGMFNGKSAFREARASKDDG